MKICIWYLERCEYKARVKAFEMFNQYGSGLWFQNVKFGPENKSYMEVNARIRDLTDNCRKHKDWIVMQELKPGDDPHAHHTVYGFDIPVDSVVAGGVDPMGMADRRYLVTQLDDYKSTFIPSR